MAGRKICQNLSRASSDKCEPENASGLHVKISTLLSDLFYKDTKCGGQLIQGIFGSILHNYRHYESSVVPELAEYWFGAGDPNTANETAQHVLKWLLQASRKAFEECARFSAPASDTCPFTILFSRLDVSWSRDWLSTGRTRRTRWAPLCYSSRLKRGALVIDKQVDVYISPAIPAITGVDHDPSKSHWSPISCTLIQGPASAVLVDIHITIKQAEGLAEWIKATLAPGTKLEYIYTTHAHGDHYFGNPVIIDRLPGVKCVATASVAKGIERTLEASMPVWQGWFPDRQVLAEKQSVPEALPEAGGFSIDGHSVFGVDDAHSDTDASSFLHVPDPDLVVAGDIVYGDCYQFLAKAHTPEKRKGRLNALDQIAALKPSIVVPGHKRASQVDGPYI